ncbi:MAG: flagellar biosynthetic protein FliQ [Planctomycetota bacterium]|nr:flagellar biosynthetic protein FliQ [Planctomycetota bacterium]
MIMDDSAIEMVRDALIITLKIAAPILAAGMVVGLLISIGQAVTSIHDQALATVPKIIVMCAASVVLMSWIVMRLMEFTVEMLQLAPTANG